MGRLTTHVLDTAAGQPAAGLSLTLDRVTGTGYIRVTEAVTNADGRTDAALLEGDAFRPGDYEIVFSVGPYFEGDAFYDDVPIRFRITDTDAHYHVPLLVAPFGYSTYRGS